MKIPNNLFKTAIWFLLLTGLQTTLRSQDDTIEIVRKPLISLRYFNVQNQTQFLILQCLLKVDKKIEPIKNLAVKIYLDDETDENNLIEKIITNENGKAKTFIPISFKEKWLQSNQHKFIAVTDSISNVGERQAETEMTIARMTMDTVVDAEARSVWVRFEERKDSQWIPVSEVEIKVGIKRQGSLLALGEEETITTDSTGSAVAEFNKDSLPGDENGILILMARVEDNDLFGNLEIEKPVPWGKAFKYESNFDERSLWATGDKIPLWLLFIAIFIIVSVWGTLIYLVFQFWKIRKLGLNR